VRSKEVKGYVGRGLLGSSLLDVADNLSFIEKLFMENPLLLSPLPLPF
jgi:hypothetical protein